MTLETDESYELNIKDNGDNGVVALITSKTFYGARNGLETLSQVIVYDNIRNEYLIVGSVQISDAPKYKYRGLNLDTSRNYFSIESIKRTINAMAMVKLNTFHWHMTDSHSFPLVLKSHPEFSRLGAYSPEKVYTPEEIKEIVRFGKARGVRVLPEFDAPAHVGEGFQNSDLLTCFNAQPWQQYCVEPPCGQFNPSKDKLYNILEDIYREMLEYFDNPDIFHMGGDEVSFNCWNSSESLKTWMNGKGWDHDEAGFMKVWNYFQENALARLDKVNHQKVPVIVWTSRKLNIYSHPIEFNLITL
jgi:hexosaminidase